ncbi:M48 family metalloprotease [Jiangella sp. DSM 45060]|uniref:M48 family metalloprotease n=1 Tax=Jiangella sp. DSM 45060 TaxID=1798224 RepID=UPI00087B5548|nr:M48 family metalloprotease [Jiangella sp. DSM 45060]SDT18543.1 hypothetical protein SAMN04515669_3034 [Jiangella sp. DSM 45060]
MSIVLALLGYALLTVLAAPAVIRGRWSIGHPRCALAAWYTFFGTGLLATAASLVVAVALASHRQATDTPWSDPTVLVLVAYLALAGLGAAIALVADRTEPMLHDEHATQHSLTGLAHALTYDVEHRRGVQVSYVRASHAFVCAVPGRPARVLVSSAAAEALTRAELLCAVEHELAHLRGRHATVLRLANVNAACLPGVAAAQAMRRSTALLLELAADDAAARAHGVVATAGALRTMAGRTGDESMRLRAERLLNRPPRPRALTAIA